MRGERYSLPPLSFWFMKKRRDHYFSGMKIKNRDIIEILSTLNLMARQKLPIKLSWKIETARNAIKPFAETAIGMIDQIKKEKALRDPEGNLLASKDSMGNDIPETLMFDKSVIEGVNTEIESLLDEEVEISNVEFRLDDFPDSMELTANEVRTLGPIIS